MSDLSTPKHSPSSAPVPKESLQDIHIATHTVGERIEQTTAGVEVHNSNPQHSGSSGGQRRGTAKEQMRKNAPIPTSEKVLRIQLEEQAEEKIEELREELDLIWKRGGKQLAHDYSEKIKELRKQRITIISLYEMTMDKLVELYKSIFRSST